MCIRDRCIACVCGGGVTSLLITDGESRAAEVFRTVPLLVVDGKIGNFPSRDFPMMKGVAVNNNRSK